MCIIQGEGAQVSKTSILVAPLPNNRQVTIYSNSVGFEDDVKAPAMILPVPSGPVEFVDLSGQSEFFADLSKIFVRPTRSLKFSDDITNESNGLITVGSYQVMVARGIAGFNSGEIVRFFQLDMRVLDCLNEYYSTGYDFIVCRLQTGATDYHPLAYKHNRCGGGKLFVPTRHFHLDTEGQTHADWDHQIYSWNCTVDWNHPSTSQQRSVPVNVADVLTQCGITYTKNAQQYTVRNYHRNHDLAASA